MVAHDPESHELAALLALAPRLSGARVLEIGAGDGRLTRRYAHLVSVVLAIDPDTSAIAPLVSDPPPNVAARAAALDTLKADEGPFDLVVFAWSL